MAAHFQGSLITISLEPKSKADSDRLNAALDSLCKTDPMLRFTVDQESGQWLLGGASEMHLDDAVGRIIAGGVKVNFGQPQVQYRERPTRAANSDYTHKKHNAGKGEFARVMMRVEPHDDAASNSFEAIGNSADLPPPFVAATEKGARSVLASGVLIGLPTIGARISLLGGACHESYSTAIAIEIAARMAMREALQKAGVKLLEPIVDAVIMTPPDVAGRMVASLQERRGSRIAQKGLGDSIIVSAEVPLATMFGFDSTLRQLSGGRATYSMTFNRYQLVPNFRSDDDPDRDGPAVALKW